MLASTSNAEGPKAMCGGALQVEMTINRKTLIPVDEPEQSKQQALGAYKF